MYLFHGTTRKNIKNIKKYGVQPMSKEDWEYSHWIELFPEPLCFWSNYPTSGFRESPKWFATRGQEIPPFFGRTNFDDGYLVVTYLPPEEYPRKIVAIFDNKDVLDFLGTDLYNLDNFVFNYLGLDYMSIEDYPKLLKLFEKWNPAVKGKYTLEGWHRDPSWLLRRKLQKPNRNCQILTKAIEPEYIIKILKIAEGGKGNIKILDKFNPKKQKKLKHKQKTFASLVWNEILKCKR